MAGIVLFGATGYTGELTARAMRSRGLSPLLVGREVSRLKPLADELGLEWATATVENASSLRRQLSGGDTLVTTVGPFRRLGDTALAASIAARATYIDSTGEPAFVRGVFESWSARAERAGVALIPACGFDNVPGHVAATLALRAAPQARTVDVAYFVTGPAGISGGTAASLLGGLIDEHYRFTGGRLARERAGRRLRRFHAAGHDRRAVSIGGSEHLVLPRQHPRLREVNLMLGVPDRLAPLVPLLTAVGASAGRVRGVSGAISRLALKRGSRGGPGPAQRALSGTHVLSIARNARGKALATVRISGGDAYDFTAAMLAWAAEHSASIVGRGALGPVEAFGVDALVGCLRASGVTVRGSGVPPATATASVTGLVTGGSPPG